MQPTSCTKNGFRICKKNPVSKQSLYLKLLLPPIDSIIKPLSLKISSFFFDCRCRYLQQSSSNCFCMYLNFSQSKSYFANIISLSCTALLACFSFFVSCFKHFLYVADNSSQLKDETLIHHQTKPPTSISLVLKQNRIHRLGYSSSTVRVLPG